MKALLVMFKVVLNLLMAPAEYMLSRRMCHVRLVLLIPGGNLGVGALDYTMIGLLFFGRLKNPIRWKPEWRSSRLDDHRTAVDWTRI